MNSRMSWLALAIGTGLIGAANALPYPRGPVTARDLDSKYLSCSSRIYLM
jgi:hypothetical protein